MSNRNAERRLQDALDALPREVLPQRDLWPGIAHALLVPERKPVHWQRQTALAALVLLMLALSLYYGTVQPRQQLPNSVVEQIVGTLQNEHELNKQMLLTRYENRQPYFPDWEQQLLQLERTEAAIFELLRDDPGNQELIEILRGIQDRQLNLIDKVFDPGAGTI
jgi:hypothetical protein